jgi:hypothetical protein
LGQVGWHPWTELCAEEDGSFTENSDTGKAERSQQLYELMREQSIAGGESVDACESHQELDLRIVDSGYCGCFGWSMD